MADLAKMLIKNQQHTADGGSSRVWRTLTTLVRSSLYLQMMTTSSDLDEDDWALENHFRLFSRTPVFTTFGESGHHCCLLSDPIGITSPICDGYR